MSLSPPAAMAEAEWSRQRRILSRCEAGVLRYAAKSTDREHLIDKLYRCSEVGEEMNLKVFEVNELDCFPEGKAVLTSMAPCPAGTIAGIALIAACHRFRRCSPAFAASKLKRRRRRRRIGCLAERRF